MGLSTSGPTATRPRVGFKPTNPQFAAGTRIDPPPSLAWANGTAPAATKAADPPLDPPGLRVGSHGLRVAPFATGSVDALRPNSGVLVRPRMTRPAARNLA